MSVDDPQPLTRRQFASDNYAGVAPEAWLALEQANAGHAVAYGEDAWTARARDLVRQIFETDCDVFFAFNGTAANAMALAAICEPYNSVICHESAHIQTDECGAPEFFGGGLKLLTVGGGDGKVDTDAVEHLATYRAGDVHFPQPRVLSITQATELGTVYREAELAAIAESVSSTSLALHMDGARFANAVAALDTAPKHLSWKAGVDVLSLGGTKLGMPAGDLVVFFNRNTAAEFEYRRKQAGQLASKMRFLAAPWVGMLETGAWLKHAAYANGQARALAAKLAEIDGIELLAPVESNAVFARLPVDVIRTLRHDGWAFYTFMGEDGVRLMCSWDTSAEDVQHLLDDVRQCMYKRNLS